MEFWLTPHHRGLNGGEEIFAGVFKDIRGLVLDGRKKVSDVSTLQEWTKLQENWLQDSMGAEDT